MKKFVLFITLAFCITACGNEEDLQGALQKSECQEINQVVYFCNDNSTESTQKYCKNVDGVKKYETISTETCNNGCNSTTGKCNE